MAEGRAPDYVGVGTLLAGTTWWHNLLLEHPGVRRLRRDDAGLRFFEAFCAQDFTDADAAAYRAHFPRGRKLVGEWTAGYMYDPWTPPLLARAAPEAKLLVLVCDPIERFRARLAERDPAEPDEEAQTFFADAVDRGRYATQLRRLHAFFDPSRVLVQQYERCRAQPLEAYAQLLDFLGLEPHVPERFARLAAGKPAARLPVRALRAAGIGTSLPAPVRRALGRPVAPEPAPLWPEIETALHDGLDDEALELAGLAEHVDLRRWPAFAHLASP